VKCGIARNEAFPRLASYKMANEQDLKNFERLRSGQAPLVRIQKYPPLPREVVQRFPALKQWEAELEGKRVKDNVAAGGQPG
jgi:hypothetical protein